ncbi:hypothetical protein M4I21_18355 [Cellulophaga sp. 20_2_10]|uniref:hypothetical protein n=1 Tax=unclassified Cellulophaga TaxID=2634405 RepID=UPI0013FDB73B|nr:MULTISPECIES: hypothetical protein [unclassified Cellulophaga]MCL5247775.1 hypothetical protein [Cellulophaga sp. 20_2_10]
MKTIFRNNQINIISENGEELEVFRETIYENRIIVYKVIDENTLEEIHLNKLDGKIITRKDRQTKLPKFEFLFDNEKIIIKHKFLDELDFNGFEPKGINIETIVINGFRKDKEIGGFIHWHPINKVPNTYHKDAQGALESFLGSEKSKKKENDFLKNKYAKWTTKEKANYHYGAILFEDRMQGGFPSGYSNPASTYLSKWFIDTYKDFDEDIMSTLRLISELFSIRTKYLDKMILLDFTSPEWKKYADKLGLLE